MVLRVRPERGEIRLTIPLRARPDDAQAFLDEKTLWIEAQLANATATISVEIGGLVPLRGEPHRIVLGKGSPGIAWTEPGSHDAPPSLVIKGDQNTVARRVERFFKREAREDLEKAVAHYAGLLAVRPARINLRDTRSRWGSCSTSGNLSFSWRLIMAPPFVLDYVAAHEVAHLREMNHGPRFWAHVADICPEMEKAKRWLKKDGASLQRIIFWV